MLEYLSRYSHRTAIGNERIGAVDEGGVTFSVRADERGGKRKIRLAGEEFIRRVLLHVLPCGLKRIRHYGLLASACKGSELARAQLALGVAPRKAEALEAAGEFMARVARINTEQCPCCQRGRLRLVRQLAAPARLPEPGAGWPLMAANSRGPT